MATEESADPSLGQPENSSRQEQASRTISDDIKNTVLPNSWRSHTDGEGASAEDIFRAEVTFPILLC
jgi:hypothetical protein